MIRIGPGGKVLMVLVGLGLLVLAADRHYGHERVLGWVGLSLPAPKARLSAGDFPAGAAAPVGDLAAMPLRPLRVGALPRASAAGALFVMGGLGPHKDSPLTKYYGLDGDFAFVPDERSLIDGLKTGGERGGYDAAILGVDRLARSGPELKDAKVKAVALVAWSRGQDAVAAAGGVEHPSALRGKKVALTRASSGRYFLYWTLAQAGLSPQDVDEVRWATTGEAAKAFKDARVDAAVGLAGELAPIAQERVGKLVATTADAPWLVAEVLVVRADVMARFPDAVRRLVRALVEARDGVAKEPVEAAKLLGNAAPVLGDPTEALKSAPLASLTDNLAFFGLRGDTPVRYDELFATAVLVWKKVGEPADERPPEESRDLGPIVAASTPAAAAEK